MGMFLTDPDCVRQREYVNIPTWHEKGYTGEGLGVFCDDVGGGHAAIVADIIQTILPKAKVYTGSIGYTQKQGKITSCNIKCDEINETLPFDEFIEKYNIGLINNSTDGGKAGKILPIAEFMKNKIEKHNLIFCGASGNGGEVTQKYAGACIIVGSAVLEKGKVRWGYTSTGDTVDFAMFSGFTAGSSFASPFLLGMAGLLRCKYPGITQDEVYEYFKAHCEDILEPGKDNKSGWGLPIMGDPKTVIKMQVGNFKATVDGKTVIMDVAPKIENQRTLVPLRFISEALGAEVGWDDKTKTVTIVR